ncbi:MAG: cell division protein SepF [Evtepia sp.]
MGLFNQIKNLVHMYEDEPEEEYDDDFDDAAPTYVETKHEINRDTSFYSSDSERRNNKVVNIHTTAQLQVILVKPERFEEASKIADHLREKRTVVLNLETTKKDIACRLIDFLSGVAYANDGKIKKVALSTFIITPFDVDIQGAFLDELENNGLYF